VDHELTSSLRCKHSIWVVPEIFEWTSEERELLAKFANRNTERMKQRTVNIRSMRLAADHQVGRAFHITGLEHHLPDTPRILLIGVTLEPVYDVVAVHLRQGRLDLEDETAGDDFSDSGAGLNVGRATHFRTGLNLSCLATSGDTRHSQRRDCVDWRQRPSGQHIEYWG